MAGSKDRVADIVKILADTLVLVLVCTYYAKTIDHAGNTVFS